MRHDKKALSGLTFVLDGPKGVELVYGVPPKLVTRVLDRMPRAPLAELVGDAQPAATPDTARS